jgi:hypothetical protein
MFVAPVRAMLLAQAFAEYLGFVECVGAAKLVCRCCEPTVWDRLIEAKLRYGHTPFLIGLGEWPLNSSPTALIIHSVHWKNDVNESGDAMEMTP